MSARGPKINLLKSRRSAHAGCRAVRTARLSRGIFAFTHLAREGRMTVTIGRRELLVALGGAAAAWPLAARAQQPERMRRIGFLIGIGDDAPCRVSAATDQRHTLNGTAAHPDSDRAAH